AGRNGAPEAGTGAHPSTHAYQVEETLGPAAQPMVFRLGEEVCALRRPLSIDPCDVGDADVEERAGLIRVGRRGQRHRRLIVRGTTADVEDQPGVSDLHDL